MKYLTIREIKTIADDFLSVHYPDRLLPIPIEDIVEIKLGISIEVKKDLKRVIDVDAYITSDFKTIIVDDHIFNNMEERSRFSLAHELSHHLLHQNLYKSFKINSEQDYISAMNNLSDDDYKVLEREANICAGYLLVPEKGFSDEVKDSLDKADIYHLPTDLLKKKYFVSQKVIDIQLDKEHISKDELIKSYIKKLDL